MDFVALLSLVEFSIISTLFRNLFALPGPAICSCCKMSYFILRCDAEFKHYYNMLIMLEVKSERFFSRGAEITETAAKILSDNSSR